jgi:hypothetical protein
MIEALPIDVLPNDIPKDLADFRLTSPSLMSGIPSGLTAVTEVSAVNSCVIMRTMPYRG